MLPPNIFSSA